VEAPGTAGSAEAAHARALELAHAHDLPLDAHLHTDLSPDADVPIDVYCALAAERGIAEIAITDHVDFNPQAPAFEYVPFAERERIAREAAERWAGRVDVRFGVEITYESAHEEEIRDHLRRHAYDYVIGSVHVMRYSPYTAARVAGFIAGRPLGEVVEPYFDEVLRAIRSGLFDTLGHLDYVKKYLVPHIMPAELADAPELYEPLLRALVEEGVSLEINTSGLRQPPAETYPSAAVVAQYRELGGCFVSTGSDTHDRRAFSYGLGEAYRAAVSSGFETVAFRRGGERILIPLRASPG
jgi:histidinol-phosphatase (PHP family)